MVARNSGIGKVVTELCIASCVPQGARTHLATRKVIGSSRTGN
jgi:hypothetical protein